MSSSVTDPTSDSNNTTTADTTVASPDSKGKGKAPAVDEPMEDDGEDEEDEEDEGDDDAEEDEEDEEEIFDEIDPSAIVAGGRRTRGVRVDYASQEALEKAGLKPDEEDDDEDDDVEMQ
ncbi:Histone H2A.Z-specific chaperone CHZ1 [Leucoagaricus sp. SymC.cos]|nr:Histone H2A.Z-specific chaperone CHZ1 [Leucoagaricus sp. SymC.cos]